MIDNCVEDVLLFADEQKAKDCLVEEFIDLARGVMGLSEEDARKVMAEEFEGTHGRSICFEAVDVYVIKATEEVKNNSAKNKLPHRRR